MPSPPHHRFHLRLTQPSLHAEATLAAPWTVLFGPSGSGKSTLLRALAGLLSGPLLTFDRYSAGCWQSLASLPPERRHLAYSPQQARLFPHRTAAENIRFPELVRGLPAARSHLPALSRLLELDPLLPRLPHQLSGGEQQRVALARALAVPEACLLLLDEPFSGLDRALRDSLLPRLRSYLQARQLPVLSVTHDPDEVLLLNADVLRLHDGRLLAHGPAPDVLADEIARLRAILPTP